MRLPRIALAVLGICALWSAATYAAVNLKFNIDNGTQQMEDNLRAFLSISRYANREDLDAATIARLQARIPREGTQALQPLGYYKPVITSQLKQDGKNWQVTVKVIPGTPVRLGNINISITGEGKSESHINDVINKQDLRSGEQLNHGTYEQVKKELLHAGTANGYIEAHWIKNDLLIDPLQHSADVTLQLETGDVITLVQSP